MKVISSEKFPIKMWLDNIETGALEQAKNLANLPFIFKHVAIMPDCHQGYGMPIGGVLATNGVIIPNAVGVDIGCGLCATKTTLRELSEETLKKIMGIIRTRIPVGFEHNKEAQNIYYMPTEEHPLGIISKVEYNSSLYQIGTLGGGNHFIEIQKDQDEFIWIMIHSGSRNIGYKVAQHYNKLAQKLNEKWHVKVPKEHDLAFLPIEAREAKEYLTDMKYCVEFAYSNRKLMMDRICEIISGVTKCNFDSSVNIAHNYAQFEEHFGKNVIVHRKGATLAREDAIGIIPGSQGSKSYIVKGKGNLDSFKSCSHGAGRRMSRKAAREKLNLEEEKLKLDNLGIIHAIRNISDLDEASSAYKDIDEVMKSQEDLVEILTELKPLAVIKG